jgi:hypothetical protein
LIPKQGIRTRYKQYSGIAFTSFCATFYGALLLVFIAGVLVNLNFNEIPVTIIIIAKQGLPNLLTLLV